MPLIQSRRRLYPRSVGVYEPAPAAGGSLAAWDAATASAAVTVSGSGGVIATCTGSGGAAQARSTTFKSSGKWFARIQFSNDAGGTNAGIGLIGSSLAVGSVYLGGSVESHCGFKNGQYYHANAFQANWNTLGLAGGEFAEIAVDLTASPRQLYLQRVGGAGWNNGSGNPVAGTGGFSMAATTSTDIYLACDFESGETGSAFTIVSATPPSGYTQWS